VKRSTYQIGLVGLIVIGLVGGCQTSRRPSDQPPTAHLPTAATTAASEPWPRSFTDDLGNAVILNKAPQRIITISPNLAEIIFLVGAGQQLAGRTDFCDYPPEAQTIPSIGGIINPSLEKLVSLEPDLVLAARGVDAAFIDRLREMQIPFLGYDPQTLDDVVALVRRIGQITGHDRQASEAAESLARRKAKVAAQHHGADDRLRVLFVLSRDPLFVAGATSFVDDMIRTCGARNAIRDVRTVDQNRPWPQASREAIVAANPQLIIFAHTHGAGAADVPTDILGQLRNTPAWREVAAVKAGQVYLINDDLVTIPGPRLIEGLEKISGLINEAPSHY